MTLKDVPIFSTRMNSGIDVLYGNVGQDLVAGFERFTLDFVNMRFSLGAALSSSVSATCPLSQGQPSGGGPACKSGRECRLESVGRLARYNGTFDRSFRQAYCAEPIASRAIASLERGCAAECGEVAERLKAAVC